MKDDSTKNDSPETEVKTPPPARLCSEIQLFDLCTKETCSHRSGRFCTHDETLAKFEAISEEDDAPGLMEELEDIEDLDDADADDAYDDEYDSEDNEEEY
jgi:hypothetical protein